MSRVPAPARLGLRLVPRLRPFHRSTPIRRLIENIFSLSVLQVANYVFPLLTVPYLARTLSPDRYGLVMFAAALVQYFLITAEYGFNLSATRQIAETRRDRAAVARIFSSVYLLKLALVVAGFLILLALTGYIPRFQPDRDVYLLTYGMVLGHAMFPAFLYQGLERMILPSVLNILARGAYVAGVFLLVHGDQDFKLVPALNSASMIVAGIAGLLFALLRHRVRFCLPSRAEAAWQLREGWHIFVGLLSSSMILFNPTFLLGLLTSTTVVGYYGPVEKIVRAFATLVRPLAQALFPFFASRARGDKIGVYRRARQVTLGYVGPVLVVCILLSFVSREFLTLVLGEAYATSSTIFRILVFHAATFGVVSLFGNSMMVILGFQAAYSRIYLLALCSNLGIGLVAISGWGTLGAAVTVVATDLVLILAFGLYLRRQMELA